MRKAVLESLYFTDSTAEIETLILKDLRKSKTEISFFEVHSKYTPFFWIESSPYTIRDRYTNVRNLIKESRFAKAKKQLLLENVFVLDEAFYTALNDASKAKEAAKEDSNFSISTYEKNMQLLKNMITNKDFKIGNGQTEKSVLANLAFAYLAFATGRRFYEIIKTLNIVKKGGKIYFKGLAKKRDEEDTEKLGFVLDDDYTFVKKALKYVRNFYAEKVENMSSKQINSKYSKNITRALNRIISDVTFHQIREQYSEVCEAKFNKNNIEKDVFKAFVLGHEIKTDSTDFYKNQKATK